MNARITQLLLVTALGTAIAASAQTTSPNPPAPDPSPAASSATGAGSSSASQAGTPAARDQEAQRLCASSPASDKEACLAREKARLDKSSQPKNPGMNSTTPNSTAPMSGTSGSKTGGAADSNGTAPK